MAEFEQLAEAVTLINMPTTTFVERHRQYFHTAGQVVDALLDAGLRLGVVTEEHSHRPADATTLRATWTARRGSA